MIEERVGAGALRGTGRGSEADVGRCRGHPVVTGEALARVGIEAASGGRILSLGLVDLSEGEHVVSTASRRSDRAIVTGGAERLGRLSERGVGTATA
jgi:hypothetical protein